MTNLPSPKTRWWPIFRAVLFLCLVLALCGLLGRKVSPVKTIVSITFDDGYADQYEASAILTLHGMQGTFYIINNEVGRAGFLTWEQMSKMQAAGHEIGGHTLTHPMLTKLQGYDLRHEICDSRVGLLERGFRVTSFAYSYGVFDAQTSQAVAGCGYNSARSVGGRQEKLPPADPYALQTMDAVQSDTTQTTLRGYIKQTERAGGGWVQLLFHHVCDECDTYSISPTEFSRFLDWLRLREPDGTVVRTVDEVIGGAVQPAISAAP